MMPGWATLNIARDHLARFVTFPSDAALDLATLWAAHTHVRNTEDRLCLDTSPRFMLLSDVPASGKTAAMERILSLCFNGRQVIDPTALSLATLIDEGRPTVGFDEIDLAFGTGARKQQVLSIVNAGYKPPAEFSRGKQSTVSTFAPIIMAGLGKYVRTSEQMRALRTRSIMVEMRPAVMGEPYRNRDHGAMTRAIRDQLALWVRRNVAAIIAARPDIPEGIDNRLREVAEPLFMVAHIAGGHWPETAAAAARELLLGDLSEPAADELDLFGQLLSDLRGVYGTADRMTSNDIVAGLYDLPASNWTTLWPNPGKATKELAAMLRPLGAEPVTMRTPDGVHNGYHRYMLEPLWSDIDVDSVDPTFPTSDPTVDLNEDETADA